MPKIDFTGVGKPVPADTYSAVVTKAEYNPSSSASGMPTVAFEWTINDGEYDGRKMFRSYSLQPTALVFLKRVLVALGTNPDDLEGNIDTDDILPELVGTECALVITVGEYNGSPNNQIAEVKSSLVPF